LKRGTFQFRPTGICLDVPPEQAPPDCWTGAKNATFEGGVTTRPAGDNRLAIASASLLAVPAYVAHAGDRIASGVGVTFGAQRWWYFGNDGATLPRVVDFGDGGTSLDRTPATWAAPWSQSSLVTGGVLNGVPFINHSDQANSLAYGVSGDAALLTTLVPAASDRFRSVRPYKYQLVGLGLNNVGGGYDYAQRVNWTASAAPGAFPATWAAAATNDAGSVEVTDCRGRLLDSGRLGEDHLIYAEGSTHLMTYTGGQEVMAFRGLSTQSGLFRPGCVADAGLFHVAMTTSDIVAVDASGVRSIAAGWVRRAIFGPGGLLDRLNTLNRSHVVHHRARREVWVVIQTDPGAGSPTECFVWHQDTGKWGHRTVRRQNHAGQGFLRGGFAISKASDVVLCASQPASGSTPTDAAIYVADEPATGPVTYETRDVLLQRHDMDLGQPGTVKLVTAIRPRLQEEAGAVTGIEVRAGGRNSATEVIAWSGWAPYAPTTDDTVQLFAQGRLISVEVRQQAGTLPWRLPGLDIDYKLRGRW
jgi:hypothetical protein